MQAPCSQLFTERAAKIGHRGRGPGSSFASVIGELDECLASRGAPEQEVEPVEDQADAVTVEKARDLLSAAPR